MAYTPANTAKNIILGNIGIVTTLFMARAPKYNIDVRLTKIKTSNQKKAIIVLTDFPYLISRNWGMVYIFVLKKIGRNNTATTIREAAAINS